PQPEVDPVFRGGLHPRERPPGREQRHVRLPTPRRLLPCAPPKGAHTSLSSLPSRGSALPQVTPFSRVPFFLCAFESAFLSCAAPFRDARTGLATRVQPISTGRFCSPRNTIPGRQEGLSQAIRRVGVSFSSVVSAICPSLRARGAPKQ